MVLDNTLNPDVKSRTKIKVLEAGNGVFRIVHKTVQVSKPENSECPKKCNQKTLKLGWGVKTIKI